MGIRLRKLLLIVVSCTAAYIISFQLIPKDINAAKETTEVLIFNRDVYKYEEIKTDYLDIVEVGSYNLPKDIESKRDSLVGSYATTDIYKGQFASTRLYQSLQRPNQAFRYEDAYKDGISLNIDLAKCVGGLPERGDLVRVIIYKSPRDRDEESEIIFHPSLSALEIIDITNRDGVSLRENNETRIGMGSNLNIPSIVTLKADVDQQRLLVQGIYEGEIHLSLRPENYMDRELEDMEIDNADRSNDDETSEEDGFTIES